MAGELISFSNILDAGATLSKEFTFILLAGTNGDRKRSKSVVSLQDPSNKDLYPGRVERDWVVSTIAELTR